MPRLIHRDLWDGNVAVNSETGEPVVFDAACVYAHNEMELAPWREHRRIDRRYIEAYHEFFSEERTDEGCGWEELAVCFVSLVHCLLLFFSLKKERR